MHEGGCRNHGIALGARVRHMQTCAPQSNLGVERQNAPFEARQHGTLYYHHVDEG